MPAVRTIIHSSRLMRWLLLHVVLWYLLPIVAVMALTATLAKIVILLSRDVVVIHHPSPVIKQSL